MNGDFVGRHEERAVLAKALAEVCAGSARVVFLAGEPGIGKTRIAQELAADARAQGLRVLWGMSQEGDATPPYWPWVEALRESDLASADVITFLTDPDQKPAGLPIFTIGPHSVRVAQFDAVASFLRSVSDEKPTLAILDDMQSSDEPSLKLFAYVARRLAGSRIFLLGAYRDTELKRGHPLQTVLADLGREVAFRRVTLRGLSRDEIAQFMEKAAGGPVEARLLKAVHHQTEGNPLFVKELVRLLDGEGVLRDPAPLAHRGLQVPEGIREMIGMRLNRLSETTNRVLALASIIGVSFSLDELVRLAEESKDLDVALAVEEALEEGILVDAREGISYQFHHALVREVLYDEVTSIRRSRLHLRFAQALEQAHLGNVLPFAARLAEHYLAAIPAGAAAKAVQYAKIAGRAALDRLAFEDAERHFGNALESLPLVEKEEPRERLEILQLLAEAQMNAHDIGAGSRTVQEVFETASRLGMFDLSARAAILAEWTAAWSGRPVPRLMSMLQGTLDAMGSEMSTLKAMLLASNARAALYRHRFKEADRWGREAVEMARELGDRATLARTLHARLVTIWGPATPNERLSVAAEMLEAATLADDREHAASAHGYLHTIYMELGEREASLRHLDHFVDPANSRFSYAAWITRLHLASQSLLEGRYDVALARAGEALEVGRRTPINAVEGGHSLQMFVITRDRGEISALRPVMEKFLASDSPAWEPGLALLYAELGMAGKARSVFDKAASQDFNTVPRDTLWPGAMAWFAEVCAFLKDEVRAARLYELLLPYARCAIVLGTPAVCVGSGARFLGLLSSVRSRWAEAEAHFQEAIAFNERLGARPALVRTRCDFAAALLRRRRGDDVDRAAALAERALHEARQMGMRVVVENAEALARAAAAHQGRRSDYPDGLTARELEVLRLIAEGATNQEIAKALFVSQKTVHNHVSNLLAKTGCANRAEAASYAVRRHLA